MAKQSMTTKPVLTRVTHPPCVNFSITVTSRITTQSTKATTCAGRWCHQSECERRSRIQYRIMARLERENVRNTLIEYMTTSLVTSPRVYTKAANELAANRR